MYNNITQMWEYVTPEMAQTYLESNENNRNPRPKDVDRYARDMVAGSWAPTGDAIRFSVTGVLLDGQHRLLACVKAGVPFYTLVVRGLPPETQNMMDSGIARTAADAINLTMHIPNASVVASVSRLVLEYGTVAEPALRGGRTASRSEILEYIRRNPDIVDVASIHRKSFLTGVQPATMGYAHWALRAVDKGASYEFFELIKTGANMDVGHPVLALIQYHRSVSTGLTKTKTGGRRTAVAAIFHTWNAWRRGEERTIIRVVRDAKGAVNVPTPI